MNQKEHKIIHIDESDRGLCYYCGKPASVKVGLWSSSSSEEETKNWRAVLVCSDCNKRHKIVDEQDLADTYLGY